MTVQCPYCGKTLSVKPESAGKKGRCPTCQQIIEISPVEEAQPAAPVSPVSPDIEEPVNTDNAETAASPDIEASINTDEAETAASQTESDVEISSRTTGIKLLKWLLLFGALFLLVFVITIAGLTLYSSLGK